MAAASATTVPAVIHHSAGLGSRSMAKITRSRDIGKGVRALKAVVKFEPYIAGKDLTLADCAAFVHLPIVTLVTKSAFGRDFLEDIPQMKPYLRMLGERPAFAQANEDRKAASAAARK